MRLVVYILLIISMGCDSPRIKSSEIMDNNAEIQYPSLWYNKSNSGEKYSGYFFLPDDSTIVHFHLGDSIAYSTDSTPYHLGYQPWIDRFAIKTNKSDAWYSDNHKTISINLTKGIDQNEIILITDQLDSSNRDYPSSKTTILFVRNDSLLRSVQREWFEYKNQYYHDTLVNYYISTDTNSAIVELVYRNQVFKRINVLPISGSNIVCDNYDKSLDTLYVDTNKNIYKLEKYIVTNYGGAEMQPANKILGVTCIRN